MCGIAGILSLNQDMTINPDILVKMADAMVHRGPDSGSSWIAKNGLVGLAHRRLSIIDLAENASQPMSNHDGSITITFNGEIYNHVELRRELELLGYEFKTDHSDTESLVHGYEAWGMDSLLQRISGDYAFSIWDQAAGHLKMARDRVGVKPLYFTISNGFFRFASEIKGLLADGEVERDIEPTAMYHYLSFLTTWSE